MLEFGNSYFATITVKISSCKNHQQMINQRGKFLWRPEYMHGLKVSLYRLLANCKIKNRNDTVE